MLPRCHGTGRVSRIYLPGALRAPRHVDYCCTPPSRPTPCPPDKDIPTQRQKNPAGHEGHGEVVVHSERESLPESPAQTAQQGVSVQQPRLGPRKASASAHAGAGAEGAEQRSAAAGIALVAVAVVADALAFEVRAALLV